MLNECRPQNPLATHFADPVRATEETLHIQVGILKKEIDAQPFLNMLPNIFLILNAQRQVVFSNRKMMDVLGEKVADQIVGLRPGEILDCMHAQEMAAGCGTAEACCTCGAALAILSSVKGLPDNQECRIIQKTTGDALEYRVFTSPMVVNGERYILFVLTDISSEKRRRVLERIFFHDVLNTVGGLRGFTEVLQEVANEDALDLADTVHRIAETVIDEIQAQKDLMAAENNDLTVHPEQIEVEELVSQVAETYEKHLVAEDKSIEVVKGASVSIESDRTILKRVLGNMLKNALEASQSGDTIHLGWDEGSESVTFWVQNPKIIPRDVQLQIFQRSYTTKGAGRGLGTHSMKLLSERYLRGAISFTSQEGEGTVFRAAYPRKLR